MAHLNESIILKEFGGKIGNNLNDLLSTQNHDQDIDLTSFSPYVTVEQLPSYVTQVADNFSILTLNCQCINSKFDDLYIVLNELSQKNGFNFSVINIQETWIKNEPDGSVPDVSMYNLPGYQTFCLGASCSSKGGLLCYVLESLNATQKFTIDSSEIWEGLFLDIDLGSEYVTLGNIYRPPRSNNNNTSITNFLREFKPVAENLSKDNKNVVLTGDFNIDLLKVNEREKYAEFFDLLITLGFLPKITFPTRFAKKSASLIDQIFVKDKGFNNHKSHSGILHSPISDHYAAFSSLFLKKTVISPEWVTKHKQDDASIKKFVEAINSSNLLSKIRSDLFENPNNTYDIIESEILKAKAEFLPTKRVKFNKYKHRKNNWITSALIKSIHHRDKLYHKLKTTSKSNENYSTRKFEYSEYNKFLNKLIKEAKTNYYNNEFSKYHNDIKKTWKTINSILNRDRKTSNFPSYIKFEGKKIIDNQEIVNSFNNYFANVGKNLASRISIENKSFETYLKQNIMTSFSFELIERNEVEKIIKGFEPKTSSGNDGLSLKLLKLIKTEISPSLTILINQSLATGIFPDKFKIAKITPLIKKPNIFEIDNFRPISLLSSISKVVEKCVFNQLYNYFESQKLFYGSQYGYRKKHSTELACLEVVDKVMHHLDRGETPICFFLDLSKAFDTLDHNILLKKLQFYGIQGTCLEWFRSYLSNRTQFVEIDGIQSVSQTINTGVPQGSILGPLLFIIYMNDINTASNKFEAILYADDTSLSSTLKTFSNNTPEETSLTINRELNLIHEWLSANKLSLNIKKTKYMVFRYPRKTNRLMPNLIISLNGHLLERVNNFDFLGLTIDETLSWKKHIEKIATKISKVIGILSRCKRYLHSSVMVKIYNSLILSRINYGITCWGFDTKRIYKLQKKALRIICKTKYNAHSDPLFIKLKTLKVKDIFLIQCLKFFYLHEKKDLPAYFHHFISNRSDHEYNTRQRDQFRSISTNKISTEKVLRLFCPCT